MAEVKKETYNGIFRECMYSCTSKFLKVLDCVAREWCTDGGFLQGFELELVWSLPAGKCRQSWYANPEPQIIDVLCNTLVLMYFLRAGLIFH